MKSHLLFEDELLDMEEFKPMKSIINLGSNLLPLIRSLSKEEIEASIDFLKKYLTSGFRHSGRSTLDDRRFNWLARRAEESSGQWIADLALRLEPCPCAEASCARIISSQRLILTSRSLRSNSRFLDARLTLMAVLPK
jgi:hypothetical protein